MKDDNGHPKQLKRGVYLTLPAARALVGVLKAGVEEAEGFELKRVLLKRQAQPKNPVDSDGHIAAYLKQCGALSAAAAGAASDSVGSNAERTGASERGAAGVEHQLVGHSTATTSASAASFGGAAGGSDVKPCKPRAPKKQQQKPETAGAAGARAGRPRKVFKADDDIDELEAAGADVEDDGNDSDTRM